MGLASAASFPASASFRGAASAAAAASASFFLSLSRELLMSEYSSSPPSNLVSRCTRQVEDALSSLRRATTGEAFDDSSSGRIPAEAEEATEASSPSPTGIGFRLTLSTWNLLSWLWTRVDFLRVRPVNSGAASEEEAALPLLDLDSIFFREAAPSFEWLPRLPVWSAGLPARDPWRDDDDDGDPGVFLRTTPLNSGSSAAVVEPRLDKTLLLMDVRLVKDPLLDKLVFNEEDVDASATTLFFNVLSLWTRSSASCSRLGVRLNATRRNSGTESSAEAPVGVAPRESRFRPPSPTRVGVASRERRFPASRMSRVCDPVRSVGFKVTL